MIWLRWDILLGDRIIVYSNWYEENFTCDTRLFRKEFFPETFLFWFIWNRQWIRFEWFSNWCRLDGALYPKKSANRISSSNDQFESVPKLREISDGFPDEATGASFFFDFLRFSLSSFDFDFSFDLFRSFFPSESTDFSDFSLLADLSLLVDFSVFVDILLGVLLWRVSF